MNKKSIENIFGEINSLILIFAEASVKQGVLLDSNLDLVAFSLFVSKDIEGLSHFKEELEKIVEEAKAGRIDIDAIAKITEENTMAA